MQISGESLSFVLTVCVCYHGDLRAYTPDERSKGWWCRALAAQSLLYLGFSGTSFVEGGGCGSRELGDISCR